MGFYRDSIYPQLVSHLGDPPPIEKLRRRLLPDARGDVLEIGAGPGVNFGHYDPTRVTRLWALEPNAGMIRLAERRRRDTRLNVEFIGLAGERIPLADACVDTVVSTFTLCTVSGILDAIRGIARVLKPEGKLIFLEISRSADPRVQRWQRWWEPLHRAAFAGLRLTRDLPALLEQGGLRVDQVECGYLARFPKSWAHCCWGSEAALGLGRRPVDLRDCMRHAPASPCAADWISSSVVPRPRLEQPTRSASSVSRAETRRERSSR